MSRPSYRQKFSDVLKEDWPLWLLMSALTVILFLQWLLGYEWQLAFMVIPSEVAESWKHLREGQLGEGDLHSFATLLTAGFLHGDIGHLTSNLLFIWIFGSLLGGLLGYRWVMVIFLVAVLSGSVCDTYLRARESIPMLGASGGLMGLEGAYLALALRFRLPDPHTWPLARPVLPSRLVVLAVFGIAMDYSGVYHGSMGISHGAHLGGFIAGVLIAGVFAPMPRHATAR